MLIAKKRHFLWLLPMAIFGSVLFNYYTVSIAPQLGLPGGRKYMRLDLVPITAKISATPPGDLVRLNHFNAIKQADVHFVYIESDVASIESGSFTLQLGISHSVNELNWDRREWLSQLTLVPPLDNNWRRFISTLGRDKVEKWIETKGMLTLSLPPNPKVIKLFIANLGSNSAVMTLADDSTFKIFCWIGADDECHIGMGSIKSEAGISNAMSWVMHLQRN